MTRLTLALILLAGCRAPDPEPVVDLRGRSTIEAARPWHLVEGPRTTHSGNPPLWPCWCVDGQHEIVVGSAPRRSR